MTLNDIIYYRNKNDPATSNIILRNNILSSLLLASTSASLFYSTHPIWSSPSSDHRNSFHFGSHPPPTNQTCPICSSHTLLHSFSLSIHLLPACLPIVRPPARYAVQRTRAGTPAYAQRHRTELQHRTANVGATRCAERPRNWHAPSKVSMSNEIVSAR